MKLGLAVNCIPLYTAEPRGPVGSPPDFRKGALVRPIFFRELMVVIAIGFIPLSPLSFFSDDGHVENQPFAW